MIALPAVGLGGSTFGNLYRVLDDEGARATFDAAWDAGIRYFDTAPHYGLGYSEERLGALLADRPREEYVLSSKVGRLIESNPDHVPGETDVEGGFVVPTTRRRRWDTTPGGIRRSIEESLVRLGVDALDIAYLHDPEELPAEQAHQGMDALLALRDEGLVRAVGAGAKDVDVLIDLVGRGGLDLVMLAGRFTLLEQPALPVLVPLCLRMGVGIVNVGVFNGGILATPRAAPGAQYEYRDAPPAVIARANRIAGVCERFGVSLPAAAAQFGLRARAVVNATFGLRTPEQVNQLAAWLEEPFDDGIWEALAYQGLLPADVVRASSAVRDGGSCHGRASTSCPDLRIFKAADLRDR